MRAFLLAIVFVFAYAIAALSADVQVSWQANAEPDIAGYRIYAGTAPGVYGTPVDVGNATVYLLHLSPAIGQAFFFAVTAYDTSGNESAKSGEVSAFVPDKTAPGAPGQITVVVRP